MINVKINGNEGEFNVAIAGTLLDIMSEMTYLMGVIYEKLDKRSKGLFDALMKEVVDKKMYKVAFSGEEEKSGFSEEEIEELIRMFLKGRRKE